MLKYGKQTQFNPNILHTLNIDRQSIGLVPDGSRVLEVGCATGFMGSYLMKKKKCYVVGVELRREEGLIAKRVLDSVIIGDIEEKKTIESIKKTGKFDVVFASALIEHLSDPWKVLKEWRTLLKKEGSIVITTSNIAHWSIRKDILQGKFDYKDYGILDNTHLRFFTSDTFRKLIEDCGYKIDHFSIDPVGGGYPKISRALSIFFPNVFAYQMVIRAKPF